MPILLGALSSLLIGISDTLGRSVSRRVNSVTHVATAMLAGILIALAIALAAGHEWISSDMVRGAVSGVLLAIALALMYRGMAISSAAVTSPLVAVFVGLIPLLWDLVRGATLSTMALLGCAMALVSLVLTTFNPNLGTRIRPGLLYGFASGLLFGVALITVGETSEASGAWPAVSQRVAGFAALVLFASRRAVPIFTPTRLLPLSVISGIAGTAGIVAFVIGAQKGDIGVVSVAGSMFPAVVVVLSTIFDDDEVRWWQALGIAGSIGGLSLIALGSSG